MEKWHFLLLWFHMFVRCVNSFWLLVDSQLNKHVLHVTQLPSSHKTTSVEILDYFITCTAVEQVRYLRESRRKQPVCVTAPSG